jgi:hypothetical protein
MKIDLTTPSSAFAFLRTIDPSAEISLPSAWEPVPHGCVSDAVSVIAGTTANEWARSRNRWDWRLGELIAELSK